MDEKAFWLALEGRVTRELAGMPRKHRGALWCDGFAPAIYWIPNPVPRVEGDAWIGYGTNTNVWSFTVFLPKTVQSQKDIDWDSLLPPQNVTCWLAIDEPRRILQIEPEAAVPDPS